ncbi:MAG TPA: plasma-membrane proton-efflux P-type ATPase [Acidiferrobacter sp.]|nr:plasma-membrane proton-efflux P-type ATPase [Acidiferrobacter sp.]
MGEAAKVETSEQPINNKGLTSEEVAKLMAEFGPNVISEDKPSPIRLFLKKLWGPVPWMLEATFALELILGNRIEAMIIAFLILFNAVLGFMHQQRAQDALNMLRSKLQIMARVLRDGTWIQISSAELVPGDYVHLRVGDFAPADLTVAEGQVLVDQSALTGESVPVEREPGEAIYSGSVLRRGEASGTVTATGSRSFFGKTAELMRGAGSRGHAEALVMSIVRYLLIMDGALVVAILIYSVVTKFPLMQVMPFALILLVASVPVALTATFTLTSAIASLDLSGKGVLLTRLAAIEESAAMNELCSDKTGTLTLNELTLSAVHSADGVDDATLILMGGLASDERTQDPLDKAILERLKEKGIALPEKTSFTPFDPSTKRSEATFSQDGKPWRAVKGAPHVVAKLAGVDGGFWETAISDLAASGARVLGVAAGPEGHLEFKGLLALADPPRPEARAIIAELRTLGVRVRMVTGDSMATARVVAAELGMDGAIIGGREEIASGKICDIYASVYPEDKFRLVQTFQNIGHTVGMTGDGVNDAPALKQAEVGIAVSSATDVAKAAASMVLTDSGLKGVVAAVKTGRRVYQRLLTYTINKIVKTIQVAVFLSLGLIVFRQFVVTPLLVLLLLFANDFVTMSIANDNVRVSQQPDIWNVRVLVKTAVVIAIAWLAYIFAVFIIGKYELNLPVAPLQTLCFLGLVFSGLANVFLVRERSYFWSSRPGGYLMLASGSDIVCISLMAYFGVLMAPVAWTYILTLLGFTIGYMVLLDLIKVPLLRDDSNPQERVPQAS